MPEVLSCHTDLPSLADTETLGKALAGVLRRGDVIALGGPLGAGKTALARAIIRALGVHDDVPSPTFTLVQTYPVPGRDFEAVWHFDLYRIETPDDVWELGVEEALETGVCLIEWPDKWGKDLPRDRLDITLSVEGSVDGEKRRATLTGGGAWDDRIPTLLAAAP